MACGIANVSVGNRVHFTQTNDRFSFPARYGTVTQLFPLAGKAEVVTDKGEVVRIHTCYLMQG